MSDKLKPCPFCDGEAEMKRAGNEHTKKRSITIKCTKCRVKRIDATIRYDFRWLESIATKAWNRRAG